MHVLAAHSANASAIAVICPRICCGVDASKLAVIMSGVMPRKDNKIKEVEAPRLRWEENGTKIMQLHEEQRQKSK